MTFRHLVKVLGLILYYGFARWLPPSNTWIIGRLARGIRAYLAAACFEYAGSDINIQFGAYFGNGRQIRIGDRSGIGIRCELHGPVSIGTNVMMGPRTAVYTENHRFDRTDIPMFDQGYSEPRPVRISDDVWIGSNVIILPGVEIGAGVVVGAGSVVTKSLPAGVVAAGNPCRVIRKRL